MGTGRIWPSELKEFKDPVSGAHIRQLTSYLGNSNHFYFTYPCWYDNGRKLMIASDRENRTNFYGIDLAGGELTQLTDIDPANGPLGAQTMTMNPCRDEAYFLQGTTTCALDLKTLQMRPLFTTPEGYEAETSNATADGKYLITGYAKDLSEEINVDLGHGYVGFEEIWAAHPHCAIVRVDLASGKSEVIHQEHNWIGHLNTSTTLPHLMTFCHEGPWHKVDNRIWGLNVNTGEAWKIRPTGPDERVGHEYWMLDGEHIGYHGVTKAGPIFGSIKYDNTEMFEAPFAFNSWHFHGYGIDQVVGDGDARNPFLLLWRLKDGRFEGPKALVWHRGSFHTQRAHVHPCFSKDGKQIVYTADPQGYGQVSIVDIPAWDALPDRSEVHKEHVGL
jgi:oligogalacturonide lyase